MVLNRDQEKVVMPKLGDIISSIVFPVQTVIEDVIYGRRNEVLSAKGKRGSPLVHPVDRMTTQRI